MPPVPIRDKPCRACAKERVQDGATNRTPKTGQVQLSKIACRRGTNNGNRVILDASGFPRTPR